ncbi:MAG: hypothetical protein IT194_07935, partial [Microthrixaceae bacterium]|nr:hypothetical protein [Microthrixaceae bacterium]
VGDVDVPITGAIGQIDVDEFSTSIPLLVNALLKVGYCITVAACTPSGVFGSLTLFRPNGTWPNFSVQPPWTVLQLIQTTLSDAFGPIVVPSIDINIPIQDSVSGSDSGTLGPFVIPRG